jgi:hypothetical protein
VILGCPGSVREERYHQRKCRAGHQWLTSVILATQETEIRSITVRSQSGQIVGETLFQKSPSKKGTGGVAQGVGPEFKPQYCKKEKKKKGKKKMQDLTVVLHHKPGELLDVSLGCVFRMCL